MHADDRRSPPRFPYRRYPSLSGGDRPLVESTEVTSAAPSSAPQPAWSISLVRVIGILGIVAIILGLIANT